MHCRTDGSKMCTMKIGILSFLCLFALTLFSIVYFSFLARSLQFGCWLLVPPLLFIYRTVNIAMLFRLHAWTNFVSYYCFLFACACCSCYCCILFFIFTRKYFLYDTYPNKARAHTNTQPIIRVTAANGNGCQCTNESIYFLPLIKSNHHEYTVQRCSVRQTIR